LKDLVKMSNNMLLRIAEKFLNNDTNNSSNNINNSSNNSSNTNNTNTNNTINLNEPNNTPTIKTPTIITTPPKVTTPSINTTTSTSTTKNEVVPEIETKVDSPTPHLHPSIKVENIQILKSNYLNSSHLERNPQLKRRSGVSAESTSNLQGSVQLKTIPKSPEEKKRIKSIVCFNLLFKQLDDDELSKVIDVMFQVTLTPGQVIINQGEDGDNFYVIDNGNLQVIKDNVVVNTLGPGRSFGEIALMYNVPRIATVKAISDVVLWGMDRIAFRTILMQYAKRKRELYEKFLEKVPLLKDLSSYQRATIADALEPANFQEGDVIIKQGEEGDIFYIVEEGECIITQTRNLNGQDSKPIEMMRIGPGDYFGEVALLKNQARAANVIAKTDVKCLQMNRKDFIVLLGPLENILKQKMEEYKTYEEQIKETQV